MAIFHKFSLEKPYLLTSQTIFYMLIGKYYIFCKNPKNFNIMDCLTPGMGERKVVGKSRNFRGSSVSVDFLHSTIFLLSRHNLRTMLDTLLLIRIVLREFKARISLALFHNYTVVIKIGLESAIIEIWPSRKYNPLYLVICSHQPRNEPLTEEINKINKQTNKIKRN